MPDFEAFIARHGEPVAQSLIENIERYSGVRVRLGQSLETRWRDAMSALAQDDAAAG